jgi:hypothetical protein
MSNCEEA